MQKIIKLLIVVFLAILAGQTVSGQAQKSRYRGFTTINYDYATLKEAKDKWHANQVRFMITPCWRRDELKAKTNWEAFEKIVAHIPELLENCRKLDLPVIIDLHTVPDDGPGAPEKTFKSESEKNAYLSDWWWNQPASYAITEKTWKVLAKITAQYPNQDIWLELMNEPLNWADFPKAPRHWSEWTQKLTNTIRTIDKSHPIVIATGPGQLWYGFDGWPLTKDPCNNIIYTLHMWQPFLYTHQGYSTDEIKGWPNKFNDSSGGFWDKARIISELYKARKFQQDNGLRFHVGEFGVARYAPDGAKYLKDVLDIFEDFGWDWNFHGFKEAEIWNFECNNVADVYRMKNGQKDIFHSIVTNGMMEKGIKYLPYLSVPHPDTNVKTGFTDRGNVILKYMSRNLEQDKPFAKKAIRTVYVIGNSLTRHEPRADIGWNLNNGMAATKPELDYVHLFYKQLCQYTGSKPKLVISRMKDEEHLGGLLYPIPDVADIVIVQVGENFRGEGTKAGFQEPYGKLLDNIRKYYPHALIFCIGSWKSAWSPMIAAAAKEHGAEFVDITELSNLKSNTGKADGKFSRWEIQWHPGNKGMREIANALWTIAKKKLDQQP